MIAIEELLFERLHQSANFSKTRVNSNYRQAPPRSKLRSGGIHFKVSINEFFEISSACRRLIAFSHPQLKPVELAVGDDRETHIYWNI